VPATLFVTTEAPPTVFRLGMKGVLLSLCLIGATVSAPTNLGAGDSKAIARDVSPSSPTWVQSTEILALQSEQDEVHSVVVDMPQVISLTYASPETWGSLPAWVWPMSNVRQLTQWRGGP
jgi:hypothetical protein